jgi:fatty acid desaturase
MGIPWRRLPAFHAELVEAGYVPEGLSYPNYRALWRSLSAA